MQPVTQMSPLDLPDIHCPTSLKMFSVYLCKCVQVSLWINKQTLNDELMNDK